MKTNIPMQEELKNEKGNNANNVMADVNAGENLIGRNIEMWVNGKYGRFLSKGVIIDFYKPKGKGKRGSLTIMKGQYLIDFGNGKKFWHTMSNFHLI